MQGKNDVPYTGTDRKVLVFASFNETLEIIENLLKQANIKFESLHGTHNEISQTIKRFQESGTVLLVNSRTHCAGLNIQFATDIVYAHKITDANIEAQVAGRGQRIGRKFNLNIWYLLFANEQEMLDRQYTEH
jgi:SNF2 family DNA or RNA helicase